MKPTREQRAEADRQAVPALGESLRQYTDMLRGLFKVPVRMTIVIRVPGGMGSRGDIVFGDDEPEAAVAAIEKVIADRAAAARPN